MTILIQNTTNTDRNICRFSGEEVRIPANDFITFDCTDFNESTFWMTKSKEVTEGIKIIVDPKTIRLYIKLKNINKFESLITSNEDAKIDTTDKVNTDVKNTKAKKAKVEKTNTVEPVVSEPVQEPSVETEVEPVKVETEVTPVKVEEDTVVEVTEPETVEEVEAEVLETVETNSTKVKYTEEYLKSLTKNELYPILDELNIKYKRNNSVSKLVSLILETNSED